MNVLRTTPVLDHGFVEWVDAMPHPSVGVSADARIVQAARASYLGDSKGDEADKRLLLRLWRDRHTSPFEHVAMTFRLKAPLFVWTHLLRHRTGKFSLQSHRYTEFTDDVYVPTQWRRPHAHNQQQSAEPFDDHSATTAYQEAVANALWQYEHLLARGVAREMARMVLPVSVYSVGYMTMDLHNLLKLLRLRMAPDAQAETQAYANAMGACVQEYAPWTWEAFTA